MVTKTKRRSSKRTSELPQKPLLQIAGYVVDTPEVRQYEGDEFTTFRVGINRFYGDEHGDDGTRWYGVAINKQAVQDWVQENLEKGTPVVVEGTVSKKEGDEGEIYFNMTGYRVGLVEWFVSGDDAWDGTDDEDPDADL